MAAPMPSILIQTVNNIYQYLGLQEVIVNAKTIFHEPRITRVSTGECDLCFPLISHGVKIASIPVVVLFPDFRNLKIKLDIEKAQRELPVISQTWTLSVKSCSTSPTTFCVLLDRERAFANTIFKILSEASSCVHESGDQETIVMTKDELQIDEDVLDLTQLRTLLAHKSLCNVFRHLGYNIETNCSNDLSSHNSKRYHICHKSSCAEKKPDSRLIYCGAVLDSATGVKANALKAGEYYRNKRTAFEKLAMGRENPKDSFQQAKSLSEAEVIADLLSVKLHDHVSVNLSQDSDEIGAKGATFFLYNYARLSCIRKKFQEQVESGIYESLPPLDNVNFSLLTQNEEWELLLLALQFPYWLVNCISPKGKISMHAMLIGMDKLCRIFSVYYRRVRVLTEPRPQLLPVMHARMYLLQCVECVLEKGLSILNMKPLNRM